MEKVKATAALHCKVVLGVLATLAALLLLTHDEFRILDKNLNSLHGLETYEHKKRAAPIKMPPFRHCAA